MLIARLFSRSLPLRAASECPVLSSHVDWTTIGSAAVVPHLPLLATRDASRQPFSTRSRAVGKPVPGYKWGREPLPPFSPKITLGRALNPLFTRKTIRTELLSFETGEVIDNILLEKEVFGRPIRTDLLHRLVVWQRAKRRLGTAKSKGRGEVAYSGRKIGKQKGSGRARHGSRAAPNFVGGGRAWPKRPRVWAYPLPVKVRRLGLATALSVKLASDKLLVVDALDLPSDGLKDICAKIDLLKLNKPLFVDVDIARKLENAVFLAQSRKKAHVLPARGLNVMDVLYGDSLVMTRAAVDFVQNAIRYSMRPRFPTLIATPASGFTPESLAEHNEKLAIARQQQRQQKKKPYVRQPAPPPPPKQLRRVAEAINRQKREAELAHQLLLQEMSSNETTSSTPSQPRQ